MKSVRTPEKSKGKAFKTDLKAYTPLLETYRTCNPTELQRRHKEYRNRTLHNNGRILQDSLRTMWNRDAQEDSCEHQRNPIDQSTERSKTLKNHELEQFDGAAEETSPTEIEPPKIALNNRRRTTESRCGSLWSSTALWNKNRTLLN